MGTNPGRRNKWVTLARGPRVTDDADGYWEPLTPPGAWVSLAPTPPGDAGDRAQFHLVNLRYRPDVTIDCRVLYGTRVLLVRGVQNVNEDNAELNLLCEEAL